MAVTANWYPNAFKTAFNGEWDWDTDTIKVALVQSAYTYSDAHDYFNDITNEVAGGSGYTAGGATLGTKSNTFTDDGSATARANSTAYSVGDVVRPAAANGHLFRCIVAGTSAGTEPTTGFASSVVPGNDVTDNTVTWSEVGRAMVVLDGGTVSWPSSTITARYAVIYKDTGTGSTSPLIGFVDFGQDESSSSGTFQITWHTDGILRTFAGYGGT